MNNKEKLKAIGCFIFGGSATFGVEHAGYKVDRVLELTNDMHELNAYHFAKNRKDIPIIPPSKWENDEYLNSLKGNYDLLYSNCPCSSLSQINRNASIDGKNNIHFYRVFNVINKIQPKAFFIENAPTLIKLGYPILQDMVLKLEHSYNFTIIRDYAGNHNVAMKRMRTIVIGWKKDIINKLPIVNMNIQPIYTTRDLISDLYNYKVNDTSIYNHSVIDSNWNNIQHLFKYVKPGQSSIMAFIEHYNNIKNKINEQSIKDAIIKAKNKLENNCRIWDKSPYRVYENSVCPSMTSVTQLIHPIYNRMFTIREYARLMGYPDDFVFYDGSKTPIIQTIAQGIPRGFAEYISHEIREVLYGNRKYEHTNNDKILVFQHHTHKVYKTFNKYEIKNMKELDHKNKDISFNKLNE